MIAMMIHQRNKGFTYMMFEMSKKKNQKRFAFIEYSLILLASILSIFNCLRYLAEILFYSFDYSIVKHTTLEVLGVYMNAFIVVGLILSFLPLIYLMSNYHDERYQQVKK